MGDATFPSPKEDPSSIFSPRPQLKNQNMLPCTPLEEALSSFQDLQIQETETPTERSSSPTLQTPTLQPNWQPESFRHPETLGTLICIQQADANKGSGIFALCDIPANTDILIEKPLLIISSSERRAHKVAHFVNNLPPQSKEAYLSLHAFYCSTLITERCDAIWATNNFEVGVVEGDEGDVIHAVFEVGSRFNHTCVPNTNYYWREEEGCMVWRCKENLKEGDEVTIHYGVERDEMRKWYGFDCACELCVLEDLMGGVGGGGGQAVGFDEKEDVFTGEEEFVNGIVRLKNTKGSC